MAASWVKSARTRTKYLLNKQEREQEQDSAAAMHMHSASARDPRVLMGWHRIQVSYLGSTEKGCFFHNNIILKWSSELFSEQKLKFICKNMTTKHLCFVLTLEIPLENNL